MREKENGERAGVFLKRVRRALLSGAALVHPLLSLAEKRPAGGMDQHLLARKTLEKNRELTYRRNIIPL